jgi:hypothetical protein
MNDTTTTPDIEDLAPYPNSEEDATPDRLVRHLAVGAQVHWTQWRNSRHLLNEETRMLLLESAISAASALHLLRAVMKHAPESAGEVARDLWLLWEDEGGVAEALWEWLTEYGIDPEALTQSVERRLAAMPDRPRVVVLCGSTRFRGEMADVNRAETLAGRIVVAPGVFAHDGDAITDEQKANLDALHLRKIDLADEVIVVNVGGYIGDSTRAEIAYAIEVGKPVRYLEPIGGDLA